MCRSRLRSLVLGRFHELEISAGDSYELEVRNYGVVATYNRSVS